MKTLSIRQPWAFLIIEGLKDIENRTWQTNYRGELLIHTGKTFDFNALDYLYNQGMVDLCTTIVKHFKIRRNLNQKIYCADTSEMGGIIGKVNLDEIVTNSKSKWADKGCFHWKLSGAKPIEFIPCAGKLLLYETNYKG